jgi:glutamyl/glutaminyl-tRNA synthetase
MKPVRTRFAPSPTGYLHIGGARTALFSWAFARRHGGQFILRIEDTDVARSTPEAVQAIIDGMNWLELTHDEGPFYQMQRMDRYKEVIQQMLAAAAPITATRRAKSSMRCAPSRKQRRKSRATTAAGARKPARRCRCRRPDVPPVVRFKNPRTASSPGTTRSRAASRSPMRTRRPDHRPRRRHADLQLLRGASTTGTWASPTSSAATTTSTTRRARSTSSPRSAPRCRSMRTCR